MQEAHSEGLAIHIAPELCGYVGNDISEALTGAHAGWVLSRESLDLQFGVPMLLKMSAGNTECLDMARGIRTPRGRRLISSCLLYVCAIRLGGRLSNCFIRPTHHF